MTDPLLLFSGTKYEVRCLTLADGSSPAFAFWSEMSESEQQKMIVWFYHLANGGRITNAEKFKKVEDTDVFEFKGHQVRIFCFLHGKTIYLTNGVRKKQDKHRRQDIKRAEDYRRWFLSQQ